jgi:hypothetical protein
MDADEVLEDQSIGQEKEESDIENGDVRSKQESYCTDEELMNLDQEDNEPEEEDEEESLKETEIQRDSTRDSYENIKSTIEITEILSTSSCYHDTLVQCNGDERSIPVNRFVLAAASPLLKKCLQGKDEDCQVSVPPLFNLYSGWEIAGL